MRRLLIMAGFAVLLGVAVWAIAQAILPSLPADTGAYFVIVAAVLLAMAAAGPVKRFASRR